MPSVELSKAIRIVVFGVSENTHVRRPLGYKARGASEAVAKPSEASTVAHKAGAVVRYPRLPSLTEHATVSGEMLLG